jgi:amino-acid N-acetyltransferase
MNATDLEFVFAKKNDKPAIEKLLQNCVLPYKDISDHLRNFILAKEGSNVVGTIGLEALGNEGLLRSLAVKRSHRNRGIARKLCEKIEVHAQTLAIRQLYLLTLTTEEFFNKVGYLNVDPSQVPESIQNTEEFKRICPSDSICMQKRLV